MGGAVDPKAVAHAQELLEQGEWRQAHEALRQAHVEEDGTPEQLEMFAKAAYGAGDYEATVAAWEAIHGLRLDEGDTLAAAHAASMVAMYLMMDSGLLAPVRGWLNRTDKLLAGNEDTPVAALSAMVRTYERFMSGDMTTSEPLARRAIELGDRFDVMPAITLGRVALARAGIFQGHVEEGLALLDEVAEILLSGRADPLTSGMVWCELVCAMLGLAQYERAAEWTAAFDRPRLRGEFFGGINGRCRVHRAEMLRHQGSCEEAEDEALHACEELRPWMRREFGWPLNELGTIRMRRGDLAGAEEAFRAAQVNGWDPQPGLALLRLVQGEANAAAAMIQQALDHPARIPSKERPPNLRLSRAPLLEAQAQIAAAQGDVELADAAATELTDVADFYQSPGLQAAAALARGRAAFAAGDVTTAIGESHRAVDEWGAVGLPWETAMARLVLAKAQRAGGHDEAAAVEEEAALTVLEGIGAAVPGDAVVSGRASGSSRSRTVVEAEFRRDGDMRVIGYDGRRVLLRDLKGMRYLERLLAEPGREFHALDLVAVEHGTLPTAGPAAAHGEVAIAGDDAGPVLDEPARQAYKRRLVEVEEDIAEAEELGDTARAELAKADRDFLVTELSRAFGIGGRQRSAVSTSERARSSVTRAVRYALDRIGEEHPKLAAHLETTVSTGTYCCYVPDSRAPITWTT